MTSTITNITLATLPSLLSDYHESNREPFPYITVCTLSKAKITLNV